MAWSNPEVDIRYLRVFVAIVQAGGFTQAQLVLGVSQSTISNQIGSLEESLGFKLCERGRGGFRLTLKGEVVYQSAVELFGILDDFREGISGLKKVMLGRLRIGLLHGVCLGNLPGLLESISVYSAIAPDVALEFSRHRQEELEHSILKGHLDLALGTLPPEEDFYRQPIGMEVFRLAASMRHPLHDVTELQQSDLTGHRFVSSQHLVPMERKALGNLRPAATTAELEEKLALLRKSQLFGYLPESVLESVQQADIAVLPDNAFDLNVPLALFRRRTRGNRIIRAFVDAVAGKKD